MTGIRTPTDHSLISAEPNKILVNNKVLITGATGATGGHAVTALLGLGIAVRALVHKNDERSTALKDQGVEVVQGDLCDFDAVTIALKGVRGAYFVYPI